MNFMSLIRHHVSTFFHIFTYVLYALVFVHLFEHFSIHFDHLRPGRRLRMYLFLSQIENVFVLVAD